MDVSKCGIGNDAVILKRPSLNAIDQRKEDEAR